jgi:hypothetical protein
LIAPLCLALVPPPQAAKYAFPAHSRQTVAFLHTVLALELPQLRTAAVVVPVNTLFNWEQEVLLARI